MLRKNNFFRHFYLYKCKLIYFVQMQVQVIPWSLNDSNYVKLPSQKLDPHKTVFVGALHGMLTAEGLAKIMNDLFHGVIYTGTFKSLPKFNKRLLKYCM